MNRRVTLVTCEISNESEKLQVSERSKELFKALKDVVKELGSGKIYEEDSFSKEIDTPDTPLKLTVQVIYFECERTNFELSGILENKVFDSKNEKIDIREEKINVSETEIKIMVSIRY